VSRFSDRPLDCSFVSFSRLQAFGNNLIVVVAVGKWKAFCAFHADRER
jgi:hypothetical protein